jgi:hypothetical protein
MGTAMHGAVHLPDLGAVHAAAGAIAAAAKSRFVYSVTWQPM